MRHFIRHLTSLITLVGAVIGLLGTTQCGGSSTSPTASGGAVSAVSLSATSVTVAGSATGTVTLSAPAPAGGAAVSLASSNTGVATVPATVTVAAGSSSIGFIVVAVAPGSAVITASMNGSSSSQSPALTVGARVALAALTLTSPNVIGGDAVFGTATLTGAAPTGGAVVTLSGGDPLTVPASVTVVAGATSATFSAFTRTVGGVVSSTITGAYGGASMSVTVSVMPPTVATASFGVAGPQETETCAMANGGSTLNCTFNGSTSTAPGTIVAWDWTYGVPGAAMFSQRTTGAVLTQPAVNCSFLPSPPLPAPPADQFFRLTVTLKVTDSLGNVSVVTSNPNARVFPSGACGF